MKQYKLKQSTIVTETGAAVMAKVIKKGTVIYENTNFYHLEQDTITTRVVFNKKDVENNEDLFELVPEEKKESL